MRSLEPPAARRARAAAIATALLLASCASARTERHVAPLYSHISLAGGGEEFESLGGALRMRRLRRDGPIDEWAVRPLFIHRHFPEGGSRTDFIAPLGKHTRTKDELVHQLLPIYRYQGNETAAGDQWSFIALPGIYWSRFPDGRIVRAWFPFGGVFERFLSFDRLVFVLFPLYARAERDGRVTYHFLFPVFAYTYGRGGVCWRLWPIYGRSRFEGRYDRYFFLWPIFHYHRNFLSRPPEQRETKWMVFPLIGRARAGSFRSTTFLWPFFGWARDPRTGFYAWDGPWPLVRIQRPGSTELARRTRFWPFYSSFDGNGLHSRYWLWPIFNARREDYVDVKKNAFYALPFWQSWSRQDEAVGASRWTKLWPLFQDYAAERERRTAFPALNPLWRTPLLDEHYAWMYELYAYERLDGVIHSRGWLGLYRRERDTDEDRASFAGLWARRRYSSAGARVRETSLLFGLLRWRSSEADSLDWLPPALPGPGWPLARVPNSILPPSP